MAKRNKHLKYTKEWKLFVILLFAIFIVYLLYDRDKKQKLVLKKQAENDDLKNTIRNLTIREAQWMNSYFNQLSFQQQYQLIPNPEEVVKDIITKLQNIKNGIFSAQPDFCQEIEESISALKGGILNSSFFSLAKIIENLLKKNLLNSSEFKEQLKKNPTFYDLIEFAKQKNFFANEQIIFLHGLREMRNSWAHEIAPDNDRNQLLSYHLWSIDMITEIEFSPWSSSSTVHCS